MLLKSSIFNLKSSIFPPFIYLQFQCATYSGDLILLFGLLQCLETGHKFAGDALLDHRDQILAPAGAVQPLPIGQIWRALRPVSLAVAAPSLSPCPLRLPSSQTPRALTAPAGCLS